MDSICSKKNRLRFLLFSVVAPGGSSKDSFITQDRKDISVAGKMRLTYSRRHCHIIREIVRKIGAK